ncbi:MAG: aminotransferase class V-fold PLP-dependent enzyme [Chitinophagaceae bacterium]
MHLAPYSTFIKYWSLNSSICFLNHGSFGATPKVVIEKQKTLHTRMEEEPIRHMVYELPNLLMESKEKLATFLHCNAADIVFMSNTTSGVNTVLNAIEKHEQTEWLITNHTYEACKHAINVYAKKYNIKLNIVTIRFPIQSQEEVIHAIEEAINPNTSFAMIDHVTSSTGIIFPVKEIVQLLHKHSIKVLLDGAHAPGMLNLRLEEIDADFYVGNCHKWICSPKGSAFLYVKKSLQAGIQALVISHYNAAFENTEYHWSSQFLWDGTHDYSAYVCIKDAITFFEHIIPDSWAGIQKHNHQLAWEYGNKIVTILDTEPSAPENMIGNLYTFSIRNLKRLIDKYPTTMALNTYFYEQYKIEMPFFAFPDDNNIYGRISAQLYNSPEQYEYLISCLKKEMQ